jgi:histone H3
LGEARANPFFLENHQSAMARTKNAEKKHSSSSKKAKGKTLRKSVKNEPLKSAGGIKKPHRFHPGVQAEREIRRLQTGRDKDKKIITRVAIDRIAREFADKYATGDEALRWEGAAIDTLREVVERQVVELFKEAVDLNGLRKRVGINEEVLRKAARHVFAVPSSATLSVHTHHSGAKAKASKKLARQKKQVEEDDDDDTTVDTTGETEKAVAMDEESSAVTAQ